jgi:hypothetical protein
MSWEVAEIVGICRHPGFVLLMVYEGVYNPLDRLPKEELFGCLRKFSIEFAAYTPLAGGYLSDRFFMPTESASADSELTKFDPKSPWAWFCAGRYYPKASAVAELRKTVKTHGLNLNEAAFRWFQWHSVMQPGDLGVIVAVFKKEQLEQALTYRCVSLIILLSYLVFNMLHSIVPKDLSRKKSCRRSRTLGRRSRVSLVNTGCKGTTAGYIAGVVAWFQFLRQILTSQILKVKVAYSV